MEIFSSDGNVQEERKDGAFGAEDLPAIYMDELSESMMAKQEKEEVVETRRRELFGFRRGLRRVVNSVFCPVLPDSSQRLREAAERTAVRNQPVEQTNPGMLLAAECAAEAAAEEAAFAAVNAARAKMGEQSSKDAAALTLKAAAEKTAADKAAAERVTAATASALPSNPAPEKAAAGKAAAEKAASEEAAAEKAAALAIFDYVFRSFHM